MSAAPGIPLLRPTHTSTQVGAIGELVVSAGILEASGGQLSPFKPLADDDGLDLLLLDKRTRKIIPLQIKCRRGFDDEDAQTVEFNVRLKTFVAADNGYVLCVRMEGIEPKSFWLIPASKIKSEARPKNGQLVVVASAKAASKDRFSHYRLSSFTEVAERLRCDDAWWQLPVRR